MALPSRVTIVDEYVAAGGQYFRQPQAQFERRFRLVPADAAADLRAKARFDVARIEEIEKTTHHDVIAFTTAVAEHPSETGTSTEGPLVPHAFTARTRVK